MESDTTYSFRLKDSLLGAQMLFVAFGALVLVPILTGMSTNVALFTAGVGTLIFQICTRGKVPVFLASSFAFIAPIIYGVQTWGLPATLGGMVVAGAAAEGCRLLATSDGDAATCEEYVRRRLGAIPPLDVFHVHDSGCTWEVRCEGGGAADVARVTVRTEVRPLPLLDGGATLLGMVNERGNLVVEVTATAPTRASWAQESLNGASVNGKAGEWRHEG